MSEKTKQLCGKILAVIIIAALGAPAMGQPPLTINKAEAEPASMTSEELDAHRFEVMKRARPMERTREVPTGGAIRSLTEPEKEAVGEPMVAPGRSPSIDIEPMLDDESVPQGSIQQRTDELNSSEGFNELAPQNYGDDNRNTPFHYTDHLLGILATTNAHMKRVGQWFFTFDNSDWFRCTASLIGNSIMVTAGHCVHEGGNEDAGWIIDGFFVPGAFQNQRPFGEADFYTATTTIGWYEQGDLAKGYDVALVTLRKPDGRANEMGAYVGYNGFCYGNCMQNYWYLTQLGYPWNYYNGTEMVMGQHLELYVSEISRGFVHGSGMEGGSSGGPHVANWGFLMGETIGGEWPNRNTVFAVTSWGFENRDIKIQGSSPLTGPFGEDPNNFRGMYNLMCDFAQSLHGMESCDAL